MMERVKPLLSPMSPNTFTFSTMQIKHVQSTPNIEAKGLSAILRDIRTSTYLIRRIERKNRTTTIHNYIRYLTPKVRAILKIL